MSSQEQPPPAGDGAGTAREEAERLVATVLATVSVAASRVGYHVPDTCECPLCRAVVRLRDPDPELAERLATGAGDVAAAVVGMLAALRGAAAAGHRTPR
jgi:hypothetical protein